MVLLLGASDHLEEKASRGAPRGTRRTGAVTGRAAGEWPAALRVEDARPDRTRSSAVRAVGIWVPHHLPSFTGKSSAGYVTCRISRHKIQDACSAVSRGVGYRAGGHPERQRRPRRASPLVVMSFGKNVHRPRHTILHLAIRSSPRTLDHGHGWLNQRRKVERPDRRRWRRGRRSRRRLGDSLLPREPRLPWRWTVRRWRSRRTPARDGWPRRA